MTNRPAVVMVARHGARLDAADKEWHLTSPAPYDPPLTYGGWAQGTALGLRIAALLHARQYDQTNTQRKPKVIIHSSPFLRCVQTSTALAAGISQFQPPREEPPPAATALKVPPPPTPREKSPLGQSPPVSSVAQPVRGRPLERADPAPLPASHQSAWLRLTNPDVNSKPYIGPDKILLRVDAFLGEWLSPDYYEDITPPPNSTMMVAGAKADLLRRSDYVEAPPRAPASKGNFPGGWARSNANSRQSTDDARFPAMQMGSLARALPRHERSSSQGAMLNRQRSRSQDPHAPVELDVSHKPDGRLYDAPLPAYAVSPAEPIPRGYFHHARDACLKVDFHWDSMREPQQWGDGGEFGDEWSTMHKRFRKGLAGMMQWYREHGTNALPPRNMLPGFTFTERTASAPNKAITVTEPKPKNDGDNEVEDEEEEELVLILVTHGAGCNALLGAITNQPVLMDINLASLSMAVRRNVPRTSVPSSTTIYARRTSIADPGMADTYEMKLVASVDHLRPGNDPSRLPQAQPSVKVASPSTGLDYRLSRRQGMSGNTIPANQIEPPSSLGSQARSTWNATLGGVVRSNPRETSASRFTSSPVSVGGPGLWGDSLKSTSFNSMQEERPSPGADMVDTFQNSHSKPTSNAIYSHPQPPTSNSLTTPTLDGTSSPKRTTSQGNEDHEEHDNVAPLFVPKRVAATSKTETGGGLWGAPKPHTQSNGLWKNSSVMWGPPKLDDVYEHTRGPKRRWTVTERD